MKTSELTWEAHNMDKSKSRKKRQKLQRQQSDVT